MSERSLTVAEALREAIEICLERDPRVYVVGEGVTDPKGIFGTTMGLLERFGPDRVIEMPVAENGMTGIAIGSAMMGQRPIMVHQRVDFSLLAMEQIVNNAAKMSYVSRGLHKVPMVIRLVIGRGWGQGPAHSQALELLFAAIPGLKVVMPTTAREAKGQLIAAVEDDNPVIFLEHRWCHYAMGEVPTDHYIIPLKGSRTVREGTDVTIVATSYMLFEALQAAEVLSEVGVEAQVIDLMVLRPLNLAPIIASVQQTGRLVVVDTGFRLLGMGAEIVAEIACRNPALFKSPPIRLGLPDHPTPSSRELAQEYYPLSSDIVTAVGQIVCRPEIVDPCLEKILDDRGNLPYDVPNPAFRGPF